MLRNFFTTLYLIFLVYSCNAQFKNNVWCFGDSAGVKFTQSGGIQLFNSSTLSRGGSCSISDSSGDVLFYANTHYYQMLIQGSNRLGVIFDRNHNLLQNGDTLIGSGLFQEQVIVPWPDSTNLFYLFTVGVFIPYGFWYSVINLNLNGGLGLVVQKNIQLTNYEASDCVAAIKHGNGRDWWVLFRRFDTVNDEFYRYLITPNGLSGPFIQHIGTPTDNGFMHSAFSKDGSQYLIVDYRGLIELYDFDRCSGLLSNTLTIEPELPSLIFPKYFGCEFSASGRYIYVSSNKDTASFIVQFDLQAPNVTLSKDTIVALALPPTGGLLKRAPDDKIYFSCVYNDGISIYPYPDSVVSIYNENLSVINFPDSAGSACNFSPFSFNLGGNETYWGLPNNPDYELPAIPGSSCDSLTLISEITKFSAADLFVYYAADWQTAFINANKLKGTNYNLEIFNLLGKSIFRESGKISPPFFTKNLNCAGYAKGMYVVNFFTDREKLTKKFVVQ